MSGTHELERETELLRGRVADLENPVKYAHAPIVV
jgi:hypothetical protein